MCIYRDLNFDLPLSEKSISTLYFNTDCPYCRVLFDGYSCLKVCSHQVSGPPLWGLLSVCRSLGVWGMTTVPLDTRLERNKVLSDQM